MLGQGFNGFEWNEEFKCVEVEKDIYNAWVWLRQFIKIFCPDTYNQIKGFSFLNIPSHLNAKRMRNKLLSHYDDLTIMFENDKATSGDVETPRKFTSNIEEQNNDDINIGDDEFGNDHRHMDDITT